MFRANYTTPLQAVAGVAIGFLVTLGIVLVVDTCFSFPRPIGDLMVFLGMVGLTTLGIAIWEQREVGA